MLIVSRHSFPCFFVLGERNERSATDLAPILIFKCRHGEGTLDGRVEWLAEVNALLIY